MSFLNKNFGDKPSLLKPVAIILVAILLIIGAVIFFSGEERATSSSLNPKQGVSTVGEVETVIAKWIEENPEAILKSVANMQKKAAAQRNQDAQKNISAKQDELMDKKSPNYSPSSYDVTIVEFFDYNCGYCKKANATIEKLLSEDKKVRVIYKDFPILGAASQDLAKVSIAVHLVKPSAYRKFHNSLMKSSARTKDAAIKLAKSIGIDSEKLTKALSEKSSKIDEIIQKNIVLGSSIGIQGTPGFVIGDELIPGALPIASFREKLAANRAK